MRNAERLSLVEIRALLEASEIEFEAVAKRQEVVTGILCQQEYWKQNREIKGLLRRYIGKMTGLGRAQVTRLIRRYKEEGVVRERTYKVRWMPPGSCGSMGSLLQVPAERRRVSRAGLLGPPWRPRVS